MGYIESSYSLIWSFWFHGNIHLYIESKLKVGRIANAEHKKQLNELARMQFQIKKNQHKTTHQRINISIESQILWAQTLQSHSPVR